MANRKEVRDALAEDLRALADDIRRALEDPKKRKRKERTWALLEGALVLGFTLAARQLAMKAWRLLTGERPPPRKPGPPPKPAETSPAESPPPPSEPPAAGTEAPTIIAEPPVPATEWPAAGSETRTPSP
jgi:hypothetical protein